MSKIKLTTLASGLRVITDTVTDVHSVALGVWAGVGTRNEEMKHNGVAHMVEHMLFKGTPARSAQQIVEVIEDVGGMMNAYTSREMTSYHVHLLKDHAALAMEVLADMYQRSVMPAHEVERERQVILQEIGMSVDTPDDLVFDNYYEAAYPGQALGAPILGKTDIIAGMGRDTLMEYASRYYTPARTIVSAAGNIEHDAFVAQVEKLFPDLPSDQETPRARASYQGGEHRMQKELEQSHVVIGFQGVGRLDEDYQAAQALSTLLGGGMSSRLFQEVREKRGLVYSIFSFHSGYMDDGQFAIYAGTGPDQLAELVPVLCEETLKAAVQVSEEEVARAKAQMKANILMGRESMMSRADQQAKSLFYRGKAFDVDALIAKIDAVDVAAIKAVAGKIFAGTPTLAGLGPLDRLESYEKISKRLTV